MAPISTSSKGLPLVQLRGYERFNSAVDDACTKVAHVMLLRGPTEELLAHLPTAFMHALNLHPRIRALQVREPAQHSEIQPLLTLEDIAARRLLRIRDTSSDEEANGAWKSHVQEETMVPFNRYEELPTFLEVWADRDGQFTRLFLFSDHYMCDGFSGRAILNDTLVRVSKLSRGEVVEHMEHPLRKGPYNLLLDAYTYSTPLTEFAIKMLYNVVRSTFCSSKPLLPPRSDQADFVYPYKVNPSYARFDSGEAATLKPAVARCKEEKVSVTGAVTAAVLLAYYYASQKYKPVKFNEDFKIIMTISTDLRPRFPEKVEEDLVGNYASLVSLDRLKTSGVKFERKFWDVARQCKSDIDAALKSPTMAFSDIALDQLYEASALPKAFTPGKYVIPNSCTGDVDISNLGQYPYTMTHTLGSGKQLTIDSLHLYESVPGVAMGTLMFVSSTDKFNYSMIHKYEDEDGDVLFRAYVAFAEHIGKIDADTTMAEVFTRVKSQLDA